MDITVDDVVSRLPVEVGEHLTDAQRRFVSVRIGDAIDQIRVAFGMRGRDFDAELLRTPWLESAARMVIVEMVTSAVALGANAGVRSVSSTTGAESDSITYTDAGLPVRFGTVWLSDEMLALLGLRHGGPRGLFPRPVRWPEVFGRRWGAEFSERRW